MKVTLTNTLTDLSWSDIYNQNQNQNHDSHNQHVNNEIHSFTRNGTTFYQQPGLELKQEDYNQDLPQYFDDIPLKKLKTINKVHYKKMFLHSVQDNIHSNTKKSQKTQPFNTNSRYKSSKTHLLISGFMRRIKCSTHTPTDIIHLMKKFYGVVSQNKLVLIGFSTFCIADYESLNSTMYLWEQSSKYFKHYSYTICLARNVDLPRLPMDISKCKNDKVNILFSCYSANITAIVFNEYEQFALHLPMPLDIPVNMVRKLRGAYSSKYGLILIDKSYSANGYILNMFSFNEWKWTMRNINNYNITLDHWTSCIVINDIYLFVTTGKKMCYFINLDTWVIINTKAKRRLQGITMCYDGDECVHILSLSGSKKSVWYQQYNIVKNIWKVNHCDVLRDINLSIKALWVDESANNSLCTCYKSRGCLNIKMFDMQSNSWYPVTKFNITDMETKEIFKL